MFRSTLVLAATAALAIVAAQPSFAADTKQAAAPAAAKVVAPTAAEILKSYEDIAAVKYQDALAGAKTLSAAVDLLIAKPSDETLALAKAAWKASRPAYMQTEGYRFGNTVSDDLDGTVNSWPLDEGLIDYVNAATYGDSSDSNPLYAANVIANKTIQIGPNKLDATTINPDLLAKLNGADDATSNVATGYHAIEFLLWGQDLNGTGPGAGKRPASDYDTAHCTNGNCDRRGEYLKVVTGMLVSDLQKVADAWAPGGAARKEFEAKGEEGGLAQILTGIGSLSYGELGGERMKLGLILHDPEEEHDCFSDNTHNSHFFDQVGIVSIWRARYTRPDGSLVSGASLRDYVAAKYPDAAKRVDDALDATTLKMDVLKGTADSGEMAYDQMIGPNNPKGNKIVQDAIDGLIGQTRAMEAVVAQLKLQVKVEGSDSLDNPSKVQAQ